MSARQNWIPCVDELPQDGVVVETKIDDIDGPRNEQPLKRQGNLWFVPDGAAYVYYKPTHWREPAIGVVVLAALEHAQKAQAALDMAVKALLAELRVALEVLVQPGDIIDRRSYGAIAIAGGNARGAQRFEVAGVPRITDLKPTYPELTRFLVSAWPLNDEGKRMSGRAGNSRTRGDDTVTLCIYLCSERFDDKRTSNEILMDVIAKATSRVPA